MWCNHCQHGVVVLYNGCCPDCNLTLLQVGVLKEGTYFEEKETVQIKKKGRPKTKGSELTYETLDKGSGILNPEGKQCK